MPRKSKSVEKHADEHVDDEVKTNTEPTVRASGNPEVETVTTPTGQKQVVRDGGDPFYGGRAIGTKDIEDVEQVRGKTPVELEYDANYRTPVEPSKTVKTKRVDETPPEPTEVSDEELIGALAGQHPVGAVSRGMGSTAAGIGLPSIPWSMIVTLLAKLNLPLAKMGFVALRNRLAIAAWPDFIKTPLLRALDALIADDTQVTVMTTTMKARYEEAGGKTEPVKSRSTAKKTVDPDESGLTEEEAYKHE